MRTRFMTYIQNAIFNSALISNSVRLCIVLFLSLAFTYPTLAQTQTSRGFNVGNSFALGDIETVNTTNGNVMIRFPLGQLPVGRNGLTAGAYLTYNSKLYDVETQYFESVGYCPNPAGCYYQKRVLKPSDEGGWHFSFGYGLKMESRLEQWNGMPSSIYPQCVDPYGGSTEFTNEMNYIHKLYITFPDGSKHEIIPQGYIDFLADRYYRVRYDGVIENCGYGPNRTGYPLTYYSVDGTFLRVEFSYDSDLDPSNNTWTMYFPDGSYYYSGRFVNYQMVESPRFYDRNNNYIDFSSFSDQFGRSISFGSDPQTNEQTVSVKGVNGEDLVWRIKWKTIFVNKKYTAIAADVFPGCSRTGTCPPDLNPESANQVLSMVEKITLPSQAGNNLSYTFSYNAHDYVLPLPTQQSVGLGELSGVTLPSGAYTTYSYNLDNETTDTTIIDSDEIRRNKVTGKTLTYNQEYDGTTIPVTETWGYNIMGCGAFITGPDGGVTSEDFGCVESISGPTNYWKSGLSLRAVSPNGTMVEKVWAQNYPIACTSAQYICETNATNPYVKTEFTSIKDSSGQYKWTAIKDYNYDKNGNVTEVREYDWVDSNSIERNGTLNGNYPTGVIPSGAVLKRITASGYYASTPDASAYLSNPTPYTVPFLYIWPTGIRRPRNLPAWSEVRNSSNQAVTRTEMFYDDPFVTGNLTESRSWDSAKGAYSNPLTTNNSISVSTTYNQYGMPTLVTDTRGTQTQITYGNITGPNGTVSDLYPTETKIAYGTSVQKTMQMHYDFYTGRLTRAIDVDNNVSTATVYDALGRPTLVKAAEGTAIETRTVTEYNDAQRFVVVRSDLNTTGDGKRVSIQNYDQLGRVRLTRTLEDSTTQSAYNESDGIKLQTRYLASGSCSSFTGNCSYVIKSNPYRAATSSAATNEPTMGWSRSKTDNGGRLREVETFSGASLPAPFGSNSNSTGVVVTDYDADRTLVIDQAGKKRISRVNGLGQLTDVWEITAQDASTVSVNFPNQSSITAGYQTSYTYDTLSNLTQVNQGVQQRTFTYSSLSRLLTATNPEGGTISYSYDDGGNWLTKQDTRNIKTIYTYDQLSRVLTKSYELCPQGQSCQPEGTPTVTYTYDDSTVPFGKGKLTKVSSGVSETRYMAFDALGKTLSSKQTTDGVDYSMSYSYNLAGALLSQTYPSGRVVKNVYDSTGDLIQVFGKIPNKPIITYANEFNYTANGAVQGMKLGNNRWESTQFNSRLQPTQIALGTTQNATDLLKLDYDYGTTDNNENVKSQTVTVPGMSHPLIQTYAYDSLNRLLSATETSNGVQKWRQAFTFDRYGNRRIDTTQTSGQNQTETNSLTGSNPVISESNNHIVPQTGEQYLNDSAGNLTRDKDGKTFVYDGENRLITYNGGSGTSNGADYVYDGSGLRVKKIVANETTIFIYNALGQMVAEYSTAVPQNPQINYLTNDTIGSPRVNTKADGAVQARHDYLPFGEEIVGLSGRTSNLGYGTDNVRQKFSGKERDNETGLDYFLARYYASQHGRFTTTDPIIMSKERLADPQRINLYVYVRNNPLNYVDPIGEDILLTGTQDDQDKYAEALGAKLGWKLRARNGKIEFVGKKPDSKKLQGGALEVFNAITNFSGKAKVEVNIDVVNKNGSIDIGGPTVDEKGKSRQSVDVADLAQVKAGEINNFTDGDAALHETLEAIGLQTKGGLFDSFTISHNWAAQNGGPRLAFDRDQINERTANGLIKSYIEYRNVVINNNDGTSSVLAKIAIEKTYRTPVTEQTYNQRNTESGQKYRAANPVDITKVSKGQ